MDEQAISFRFKNTDVGRWEPIDLDTFLDLSFAELAEMCEGKEVVCEITHGEWKGYLCGTEKWVEHYRKKGFSAKGFMEGVSILREKGSPLVADINPLLSNALRDVEDAFPGSKVEQHALF